MAASRRPLLHHSKGRDHIVFAWEQALALTTENERGTIASHRFPMFLPVKGKADLNFMFHFFMRKQGKALLALASPGGAGRNKTLGQSEFMKLKVTLPNADEQKKIAYFLSTVSVKMETLQRKHAALKRYKIGLIQKLFNRSIRFTPVNEGSYPDWSEKSFGDLYVFIATNSLSRDSLSDSEGEVQNIHYGDIHTRFKSQFRQEDERIPFIKPDSMPNQIDDEQFCRVGDIVIADASEDYADIGKAIEILSVRDKSLVAGLHTFIARPRSTETVVGYAGYMLQAYAMRRQIMRIAQGISVLGISKPKLAKLRVPLPHPEEQRKIADALAAVDAKIQATKEQIERMEAFKKGLVQKMFA